MNAPPPLRKVRLQWGAGGVAPRKTQRNGWNITWASENGWKKDRVGQTLERSTRIESMILKFNQVAFHAQLYTPHTNDRIDTGKCQTFS